MSTDDAWIYVKAQRALYVDRGRDVILCDRLHSGEVELVLRVRRQDARELFNELSEVFQ